MPGASFVSGVFRQLSPALLSLVMVGLITLLGLAAQARAIIFNDLTDLLA